MADVIAAWKQAQKASRISPVLAGYRPGADPLRTCSLCGYHDGAECLIVAGITADTGTCALWQPQDAASLKETQCSEPSN